MKLEVFTVHDKATGAFLPPFFTRSLGEAVRSFMDAVKDTNHQFSKHADDYVLYHIGKWDDNSGMFESGEPYRVMSALETGGPDRPN